jgi:hypothetical protein
MIIFSWNCQRLGNLRVVQDLCRMVKNKNPNLVLFMETKMRKKRLKKIRHRLGFSSLFAVDCVGKGGGFGLLWKENAVVEIQNFSHRHINAIIHLEAPKRHKAWTLLRHLSRLDPLPWMCIGDFNEVVNGTEKWGGNVRHRRAMQEFQQVLEDCNLIDLGFCGPKYT